ncbi:leucine-rich repeat-containing protein 34-like isoform X2 [Paramacrobiotus metropolitanus]|uniref:leucine-rich repeat-containing protein 34-like isoform X2 n=1 Tax=Paramacrobiotus metropolitanus TaxID=2943436 RepID=UPI00244562B2|nr:leucine-rich repeat-containing protein 34-like isoform X2 [Paramacrobiotus metropolitanus]
MTNYRAACYPREDRLNSSEFSIYQPDPDDVPDPEEFQTAVARFGQRPEKDAAHYLESYISTCEENEVTPVPQMFRLLQAKAKKNLVDRLQNRRASVYLPGNDSASNRRLDDIDLAVICSFMEYHFPDGIRSIDLRYNVLEDAEALCTLLKNSTAMKAVNLMYNPLTETSIATLASAALVSKCLVNLCLNGVKLAKTSGLIIADLVINLPSLRYLGLAYCEVKLEVLIAIMIPIKTNVIELSALDITSPNIPDWASKTVFIDQCADMLVPSKYLKELYLGKMGLDDFALERLLPALQRNTSLQLLDLHGNKLNRDGARMLMRLIQNGSRLEVLNLDCSSFTDEGAEYMANAIYESDFLKTISLRFCRIGDQGIDYLSKAIAHGKVSRIYVWQGTSIKGPGCKAFCDLMNRGRIQEDQTDVRFYKVDEVCQMAENSHAGIRRWELYTPNYGGYSHQACYDGFAEPEPQPYFNTF